MKKLDPEVKKMSQEEKKKLLENEVALINKKYKKTIVGFGNFREINRIPFRYKELNDITGGGVPTGRFSILWGAKGSAKTTNCYDLVEIAQKQGKLAYWVDLEQSFDPTYASYRGVNIKSLLIGNSFTNAEEAMDSIIGLTKKKLVDLVIIDSIQGLSPKGEQETKKGVEKSVEDDTMALLARKLSQFFRMSAAGVAESECTIVLIGQTRKDLGGFITLDRLSGGNALEHWSSLTVHLRRGKKANAPKKKDKIVGFDMVAKIDKSKVGPDEGKECHIPFYFGKEEENEEDQI